MITRLISWNTAHRAGKAREQADALRARKPDIVALQEVTDVTAPIIIARLAEDGLVHHVIARSRDDAESAERATKVALVSRYTLGRVDGHALAMPWPEQSLSMSVDCPGDPIELHTVHVPPGTSHGWLTVDFLEAVYRGLAQASGGIRVLCGDFNAPQLELPSGEIVTWAQRQRPDGSIYLKRTHHGEPAERWDAAERNVLIGLSHFDLADAFRDANGYGVEAHSRVLQRKDQVIRRRFDHTFASKALQPISCTYLTDFLDRKLSDHAPMETVF